METENIKNYVSKLKDIQFIRNNIVHSISIFTDVDTISKISKKHKDSLHFNSENQFLKITKSKFIKELFKLLKEFYEDLFWLIDKKQNSLIVLNGLSHWLGLMDNKIMIENFKFIKFTSVEKQMYFKVIPNDTKIPNFECKITLKKSTQKSFESIIQVENDKINEFFNDEKDLNGYYLQNIFIPFNLNSDKYQIKLMVY